MKAMMMMKKKKKKKENRCISHSSFLGRLSNNPQACVLLPTWKVNSAVDKQWVFPSFPFEELPDPCQEITGGQSEALSYLETVAGDGDASVAGALTARHDSDSTP
ncbi:uncharacterized protein TRIREDRAFT_109608 [Trichoderma reesei QM6a]|uniref:Predicted protein n=1 Tax=Hypocrea jecorina (strain QM6a) TaxID=431241 RepID=G0RPN9_HYPJQ|nr:uncharacterized protein TRIREDRAFT_109608 [Trichoderma reesei QM6a]EGR46890.1 predicted protein [Trichoderma reesei QM6a]